MLHNLLSHVDLTAGEKQAVYYQRSKSVHEEVALIECATEREITVGKLEKLIRDVKERRRFLDDEGLLDALRLINQVRDSSIRLIYAISKWQEAFTKPIRPTIYKCDYIIEKMIRHIDFINSFKIRKIFNFQTSRGNALLLPFPNLRNSEPIKVHTDLGKEIRTFAYPDEEKIIFCYQFLLNCLPKRIYEEELISLQKWLLDPWIPRIFVTTSTLPCFIPDSIYYRKTVSPLNLPTIGSSLKGGGASNSGWKSSRRSSTVSKEDSMEGETAYLTTTTTTTTTSNNNTNNLQNKPFLKRRNMMNRKEQQNVLAITLDEGDPNNPQHSIHSDNEDDESNDDNANNKSSPVKLSEVQQAELKELELYYKELESMFIPKLTRRAVKTMVALGHHHATNPSNDAIQGDEDDAILQDKGIFKEEEEEFRDFQPKRAFHLFTTKAEDDLLQRVDDGLRTENFHRTNAHLVAKRNRIISAQQSSNKKDPASAMLGGNGNSLMRKSLSGRLIPAIAEEDGDNDDQEQDGEKDGEEEEEGEGDEEGLTEPGDSQEDGRRGGTRIQRISFQSGPSNRLSSPAVPTPGPPTSRGRLQRGDSKMSDVTNDSDPSSFPGKLQRQRSNMSNPDSRNPSRMISRNNSNNVMFADTIEIVGRTSSSRKSSLINQSSAMKSGLKLRKKGLSPKENEISSEKLSTKALRDWFIQYQEQIDKERKQKMLQGSSTLVKPF
jgi:hypothetical protein